MGEDQRPSSPDPGAPAQPGAGRVFLSYASADATVAERVVTVLEAAGLPVWIAPRDVPPGESYAAAIVDAINDCRLLVLVLSRAAAASPHVLREIERASSKNRPILSVRLEVFALPKELEYFLSANQWLEAPAGIEPVLPALVKAARAREFPAAGVPVLPAPTAMPGVGGRRTRSVLWLGLGGIAALALTALIALKASHPPAPAGAAVAIKAAAPAGAATAVPAGPSVAVLPFTDLSEKKDQEYFSDGLSDELIDLLAKVPGLRVPARTSSFYFKGKQATLAEIGHALNVSHVLEGSVRKSGQALRVTAELVETGSDTRVWSQTYDRKLDDLFKVQDEIAGAVVKQLQLTLLAPASAAGGATRSSEAHSIYLQGKYLSDRNRPEDLKRGEALLKRALALDPGYALAWAVLAVNYERQIAISLLPTDGAGYQAAVDAAERAIKIDPSLAIGWTALGAARLQYGQDYKGAGAAIHKALALDPNDPRTLDMAGHYASATGTPAEAVDFFRRGVERDPLDLRIRAYYGKRLAYAGDLPGAERVLREALELDPTFPAVHYFLGVVLLQRGENAAALAAFEAEPSPVWRPIGLPLGLRAVGRNHEADEALKTLTKEAGSEFQTAEAYAYFGDKDEAFHWLDQSLKVRDPGLIHFRGDAFFKPLESDPRYAAFAARLGQPPAR